MEKDKKVRAYFCPKCRSFKVRFIFGLTNIFGVIPKQKCFDCGFMMHGNFPIIETTKENLEKDLKKSGFKKKKKVVRINSGVKNKKKAIVKRKVVKKINKKGGKR